MASDEYVGKLETEIRDLKKQVAMLKKDLDDQREKTRMSASLLLSLGKKVMKLNATVKERLSVELQQS